MFDRKALSTSRLVAAPLQRVMDGSTSGIRRQFRRVMSTPDRPARIALGLAVGVFFAFSPLLGLQMLLAVITAIALRVPKAAALAGTMLNLPWTAPFYYAAEFALGGQLLGLDITKRTLEAVSEQVGLTQKALWRFDLATAQDHFHAIFGLPGVEKSLWSLFTGSVIIGLLAAFVTYHGALYAMKNHFSESDTSDADGGVST